MLLTLASGGATPARAKASGAMRQRNRVGRGQADSGRVGLVRAARRRDCRVGRGPAGSGRGQRPAAALGTAPAAGQLRLSA